MKFVILCIRYHCTDSVFFLKWFQKVQSKYVKLNLFPVLLMDFMAILTLKANYISLHIRIFLKHLHHWTIKCVVFLSVGFCHLIDIRYHLIIYYFIFRQKKNTSQLYFTNLNEKWSSCKKCPYETKKIGGQGNNYLKFVWQRDKSDFIVHTGNNKHLAILLW